MNRLCKHCSMGKYAWFLLFLLSSCSWNAMSQHDDAQTDALIKKYCTQRIERRDSLLIIYTQRQWRNIVFYWWGDMSKYYNMNNDDIQPYISAVFYSPDRKKMVCWLGEKMPNAFLRVFTNKEKNLNRVERNGPDTIYNMTPMFCYRDDTTTPWTIRIFWGRQTGGYTKEIADRSVAEFLFIDLKGIEKQRVIPNGVHKWEMSLEAFGYNLQDPGFWDSCWVMQKDTVGSIDLYANDEERFEYNYLFPEKKDYEKCYKCATSLNYPTITYPKEIMDMYGK